MNFIDELYGAGNPPDQTPFPGGCGVFSDKPYRRFDNESGPGRQAFFNFMLKFPEGREKNIVTASAQQAYDQRLQKTRKESQSFKKNVGFFPNKTARSIDKSHSSFFKHAVSFFEKGRAVRNMLIHIAAAHARK